MTTQCSMLKSLVILVGRICFSLIFIIAGFDKLIHFSEYSDLMASKAVPYYDTALVLAIIFELGGGLSIFLGLFARFGAFLIFIFLIPVTFYFHPFWDMVGSGMVNNVYHFFKNLSIFGATFYIMACGAGHISCDGLLRKKCCQKKSASSPT